MNLRLPENKLTASPYASLEKEVGVTLGTEALRVALQQNRILDADALHLPASLPLPVAYEPPPAEFPSPADKVEIEPIASHVPSRMFLYPLRQLYQLALAARYAGKMGRRCPKSRRPPRFG